MKSSEDLRLRIQKLHQQLEKAQSSVESLLILKERVLVVAALEDAVDAFECILPGFA
jgi:hypothetical protein